MSLRAPWLFVSLLVPACVVARVGDGKPATLTRSVGDASALSLENFLDTTVTVDASAEPTVAISCDASLLDDITTEVEGDTLRIHNARNEALLPQSECHAEVTLRALDAVSGSGSGTVLLATEAPTLAEIVLSGSGGLRSHERVGGLEAALVEGSGDLDLDLVDACDVVLEGSGSGELRIAALTACAIVATGTGSGDVVLGGAGDEARVTLTGSGDFGHRGLVVGSAWITASGSGDAEITATDYAGVTLTGSGDARVFGDPPQRDVTATGSGQADFL